MIIPVVLAMLVGCASESDDDDYVRSTGLADPAIDLSSLPDDPPLLPPAPIVHPSLSSALTPRSICVDIDVDPYPNHTDIPTPMEDLRGALEGQLRGLNISIVESGCDADVSIAASVQMRAGTYVGAGGSTSCVFMGVDGEVTVAIEAETATLPFQRPPEELPDQLTRCPDQEQGFLRAWIGAATSALADVWGDRWSLAVQYWGHGTQRPATQFDHDALLAYPKRDEAVRFLIERMVDVDNWTADAGVVDALAWFGPDALTAAPAMIRLRASIANTPVIVGPSGADRLECALRRISGQISLDAYCRIAPGEGMTTAEGWLRWWESLGTS